MIASTVKSAALAGARDGLPFWVVVGPLSVLFGVLATEAGLTLTQTLAMTTLVIAGASQFAALQLMQDGAGFWLILAGALAVNLRMMMYSAALIPWLGPAPLWQRAVASFVMFDQPYALGVLRYEARPAEPVAAKIAYYLGVGLPMAVMWVALSMVGALVGARIPEGFALDFALPITFIALVAPMLKTLAHVAAAATSVVVALALRGMPAGTGLLIAAAAAMAVGATVETVRGRWA
ncbi:AzlC family ABC transporter permease [Histidinibacterium lentulum]|uniref:Branched-chain amino acid ABC transporter permease n=1 Tax=Histidinibacterium lentulum TaxID=2480588 RepID=A0A3N2R4Y6_9RHOB|nr:AzlC family ABC transporter permease [Histidinibacterium lentulum]ROU02555.1 branched-chain amino acid ABC transporter permease [Histidinibacterium lentulum]